MAVKRIGLFGNFGGGNLGNEGSLEAMLLFLRQAYPDADMVCICTAPDVIREQFSIPTLPISAIRSLNGGKLTKVRDRIADHVGVFRNVRNLNVLLVPGTGVLDDFGERPIGFPYSVFLVCLMAKLRGIKVAFVSIGAGPIVHPLSRWFMKSAARLAAYRSYRDTISKEFMGTIGLDVSNDPVYPDLAFGLPNPVPVDVAKSKKLTVGLGVMAYYGWSAAGDEAIYDLYMAKLATFAIWLLRNGYRIRILIGESTDQQAVDDLTKAIAGAIGTIPPDSIVADTPHSLVDIMTQIFSVDVVVATRFHNVLCALKVGKPTISLGYARKNDVLMEEMGLGAFCHNVERFHVDALIQQFNELIEKRGTYREIITKSSASLQHQLQQQEQFLIQNLIGADSAASPCNGR